MGVFGFSNFFECICKDLALLPGYKGVVEAMGNDVVAQKELRFSARALADEVKIAVDFVVPPGGQRTVDAGILTATVRSSLKELMAESQFSRSLIIS